MVNNYGQNKIITDGWNFMQENLVCCGVGQGGPSEWRNTTWWNTTRNATVEQTVPESCCFNLHKPTYNATACYRAAENNNTMPNRRQYVNVLGCEESLDNWFLSSLGVLIGGTVAVIITQIVVVVMACCLRRSIKNAYEHV
jgi:hypothetical protein